MTDPFARLDGAYSLGALEADDLAAYEAHLRTCADCRARVAELRPTMQLLAASRAAVETDPPPVPDTLLPDLLRRAARERARRTWVLRSVAGLAAACLVSLAVVLWPSTSAQPAARSLVAVRAAPVEASARLVSTTWGTRVDVHCRYERYAGSAPVRYGLRIVDRDRRSYDLGSWTLVPDHAISFTAGTAVRRERIARVQVTLPDGTPILQLTL